jgi:hypothetical protein
MMDYAIERRSDGFSDRAERLHRIPVAVRGTRDGNAQLRSLGAFREREMGRRYPDEWVRLVYDKVPHWFEVRWSFDWLSDQQRYALLTDSYGDPFDPHAGAQVVDHESVWAFYLAIGYDYKKRRFIR